jgi:hypothetical protein
MATDDASRPRRWERVGHDDVEDDDDDDDVRPRRDRRRIRGETSGCR